MFPLFSLAKISESTTEGKDSVLRFGFGEAEAINSGKVLVVQTLKRFQLKQSQAIHIVISQIIGFHQQTQNRSQNPRLQHIKRYKGKFLLVPIVTRQGVSSFKLVEHENVTLRVKHLLTARVMKCDLSFYVVAVTTVTKETGYG